MTLEEAAHAAADREGMRGAEAIVSNVRDLVVRAFLLGYTEGREEVTAERDAARLGLFSHLTGEHALAEPTYSQLRADLAALRQRLQELEQKWRTLVKRFQVGGMVTIEDCADDLAALLAAVPEAPAFHLRMDDGHEVEAPIPLVNKAQPPWFNRRLCTCHVVGGGPSCRVHPADGVAQINRAGPIK